jgi:hypothetical protein
VGWGGSWLEPECLAGGAAVPAEAGELHQAGGFLLLGIGCAALRVLYISFSHFYLGRGLESDLIAL